VNNASFPRIQQPYAKHKFGAVSEYISDVFAKLIANSKKELVISGTSLRFASVPPTDLAVGVVSQSANVSLPVLFRCVNRR